MLEDHFSKIIKHTENQVNESSRKNIETEMNIKKHKKRMEESRKNMKLI